LFKVPITSLDLERNCVFTRWRVSSRGTSSVRESLAVAEIRVLGDRTRWDMEASPSLDSSCGLCCRTKSALFVYTEGDHLLFFNLNLGFFDQLTEE